jgi:FkbM family methyltransferase
MSSRENAADPLLEVLGSLGSTEKVRRHEETLFDRLSKGARRAVIFGCGHLGAIVLRGAKRAGIDVAALADNNPALWGTMRDGLPIMSPADAFRRHAEEAYFVIAVYNSSAPRRQLRDLGCERVVPFAAFYWRYPTSLTDAPGMELPHRILESDAAMRAGYSTLADDTSRREFASQIAWRCTLDYSRLPPPDDASEIYFPPELLPLSDAETLVDCGAFDGDSVRLFLEKTGGAFRAIYACEPDPANRERLSVYLSTLAASARDNVFVVPYAIGDRDGVVHFNSSGTAGSRITADTGPLAVECRRLDTLLEREPRATIIKMDIEGAEPAAIAGATATMRRDRPALAVCAYHACEHLWTLPSLMKEALPDYQIYLRRYAEECWETVYYAIPSDRRAG